MAFDIYVIEPSTSDPSARLVEMVSNTLQIKVCFDNPSFEADLLSGQVRIYNNGVLWPRILALSDIASVNETIPDSVQHAYGLLTDLRLNLHQ